MVTWCINATWKMKQHNSYKCKSSYESLFQHMFMMNEYKWDISFTGGTGLYCQLLKRLKPESHKFKAIPGNFTRLCLKMEMRSRLRTSLQHAWGPGSNSQCLQKEKKFDRLLSCHENVSTSALPAFLRGGKVSLFQSVLKTRQGLLGFTNRGRQCASGDTMKTQLRNVLG